MKVLLYYTDKLTLYSSALKIKLKKGGAVRKMIKIIEEIFSQVFRTIIPEINDKNYCEILGEDYKFFNIFSKK
jgi:hypothetical protein